MHGRKTGGESDLNDTRPQRPPAMRSSEIIRLTAIASLTVIAVVALLLFFVKIRSILLWVLIGIILAIALQPAVGWLERHRWNRLLASLVVSFATIAVIAAAVVAIAWPVVGQSDVFIRDLPRLVTSLFGRGGDLHFLEVRLNVIERLRSVTPGQVANIVLGNQQSIVSAATKAAYLLAATITILTIMVMLLIEGPRGWTSILDSLVGDERRWVARIGENFLRATGGYVRGNLAISLVAGVSSYIVLKVLGVPYAETLAVLVAILDIIPLVGATIGAVIVTIVGFATGTTVDGVVLIIFFVAYQQFENNVLQNVVYAKTLTLSPLVVFIAALIGATLAGIVGVLLAIPLTSAGWTLGRDLIALRKTRHAAQMEEEGRGEGVLPGAGPAQAGTGAPAPGSPGGADLG
jgi:predicted PurR-regulated permease PerM